MVRVTREGGPREHDGPGTCCYGIADNGDGTGHKSSDGVIGQAALQTTGTILRGDIRVFQKTKRILLTFDQTFHKFQVKKCSNSVQSLFSETI